MPVHCTASELLVDVIAQMNPELDVIYNVMLLLKLFRNLVGILPINTLMNFAYPALHLLFL